ALDRIRRPGNELRRLAVAGRNELAVHEQACNTGLGEREAVQTRLGRRESAGPSSRPEGANAGRGGGQVNGWVHSRERGWPRQLSVVPIRAQQSWTAPGRRGQHIAGNNRGKGYVSERALSDVDLRVRPGSCGDPGQRSDGVCRVDGNACRAAGNEDGVAPGRTDHGDG